MQTGTSYPAVRDSDVMSQSINHPISISEQYQIVSEIESRLSVCDKIEETIEQSLTQAEALRQSILKKAFEGKLLSEAELNKCRQDPTWEPASVLLERIKKEKENTAADSSSKLKSKRFTKAQHTSVPEVTKVPKTKSTHKVSKKKK